MFAEVWREMWNKCISCSVAQRQYLNASVQESFRAGYTWCVCPVISPPYCFSRQQTLVQGTIATKIETKIHFLSLFVRACDINQQPCFLSTPHPVITETKALAAPHSATFPFCPSVAVKLSGFSQLIETEWNPNKTAGHNYDFGFGVVWKRLFAHSLQMAMQQNSLIHRARLASLRRCGYFQKSGIQHCVVKLLLVVFISRNSRQKQFLIYGVITYLF